MSLIIELKNIGGLRGEHSFSFKKALNILSSPNASGKSSLLKALFLIMANENIPPNILKDILTERELEGFVRMSFNNQEFEVQLQQRKDSVDISFHNVDDSVFSPQTLHLGFLQRNTDIYDGIYYNEPLTIKNWFSNMTEVHKYRLFMEISQRIYNDFKEKTQSLGKDFKDEITERKSQVQDIKTEIKKIDNEIKSIESSPSYKKYITTHVKEETQLKNLTKRIKEFQSTLSKIEDEKTELNIQLEQKNDLISKKKQVLEDFEKERPLIEEKLYNITLQIDEIKTKINNLEVDKDYISNDLDKNQNLLNDYKQLEDREDCPCCHQKLNRKLIKDLIEELKKRTEDLKGKKDVLNKEIRYCEVEKQDLEKEHDKLKEKTLIDEAGIKKEIEVLNSTIINIKKKINKNSEKIEEFEAKIDENYKNQANITKKLESKEKDPKIQELHKKREIKSSKERLANKFQREIDEFEKSQVELKITGKKSKIAEIIKDRYVSIVQQLLSELSDRINEKLEGSFELLQLAELEKITISSDGDYKIDIQRKNKVYTTLSKMSGAERELIVLIIFFIVQRTVLPQLPIFLIDEVTSDMDDTRFNDILEYISKEIDYVIVARPSPFEGKKQLIKNEQIISK